MMEAVLPRSWKEEFALAASLDREEVLYREKMKRFETREREKREEIRIEQKHHDQEALATFEAAFAAQQVVIEYRHDVDNFGVKTVEALMDNQEARDRIREKMNPSLTEAHVLPDGRRVFKSHDGQHVFDEHGHEVARDTVDPSSIDDNKPKWEPYKMLLDEANRLDAERVELLEYQAKLDEAKDRLAKGKITNGELDRMKADLAETMPDAVREKLGLEKPKAEADQNLSQNAPSSLPNNMDALVRQSGAGPSGP